MNALGVVAASLLAAASLDPTFDGDGKLLTDFGGRDSAAHAVVVQPDGKVVAAGEAGGDFALARYKADGSVDVTTTTDFGGSDRGFALVVQADGRIVVAGSAGSDFALARYNQDGSLDRKVVTDLGGDDGISRVLPAPRGRLVAVGVSGDRVALVWYRPDLSVERRVFGPLGSPGLGAAAAPGGKIVVAAPRVVNPRTPNPRVDYRLVRFRPDGRLDRTFGGDGLVVRHAPPHWTGGSAVAVKRDGSIVLVGHGHREQAGFAVLRFRADGRFDGASVGEVGFGARAVAVDRSGRLVVTGAAYDLNDFVVARFTARGRLDASFTAAPTDLGAAEAMWAIAIQPDGRVVVAGQSGKTLALARFRA